MLQVNFDDFIEGGEMSSPILQVTFTRLFYLCSFHFYAVVLLRNCYMEVFARSQKYLLVSVLSFKQVRYICRVLFEWTVLKASCIWH